MTYEAQIRGAILKAARKIIEANGGDIDVLFTQLYTYDGGVVILEFIRLPDESISAIYNSYGKKHTVNFKETDL